MYLVNTIMMVIGIVMVAVSASVLTHHQDLVDNLPPSVRGDAKEVGATILKKGPMIAAVTGGGMLLLGLLGCCAAKNYEKKWAKFLLCLYSVLALVLFALSVAAGAIELGLSGKLRSYSVDGVDLNDELGQEMHRFSNATFSACCTSNHTLNTGKRACTLLNNMIQDTPDACDSQETFQPAFFSYLAKALKPLGIVSLVTGIISLFVLVASCCLLWRKKKDEDEAKKAAAKGGQAGGAPYYGQATYAPPAV